MSQPFEAELPAQRPLTLGLRADQVLFFALMVVIVGVRVANLSFNSLFVDEAIYATVGRNVLAGAFDSAALRWMYGSYLYPVLTSLFAGPTGEAGLRLVSAVLSSAAAGWVYLATVRLFGQGPAVWATLCFGLTAISIDMGQFAVYDALAVPALACCLYLVVRAADASPTLERRLLLAASAVFVIGTLAKYFAALYLPALICVATVCALQQGRSLRAFGLYFLAPATLVLAVYGWVNLEDLRFLLAGNYGVATGARDRILNDIWAEIGVTSLIALAGLAALVWHGPWEGTPPSLARRALWALLVPVLSLSLLAAPLYHLLTANQHAAWKHTVYSLIFLAPLAGYACHILVTSLRALPGRTGLVTSLIGAVASAALVVWGVDYALDRNWGFQHSWPNARGVVAYLERAELVPGEPVLAEGAPIYTYYLFPQPEYRAMWTSTWYAVYGEQSGVAAMEAAIADHYYQAVILDGYHTPELRDRLATALHSAGYRLGYEETQQLSLGFPVTLAVYHAP